MAKLLRRFTPAGLRQFEEWLDGGAAEPTLSAIIDCAESSEPISGLAGDIDLSVLPKGCSRLEFARMIVSRLPTLEQQSLLVDDECAGAYLVAARFDLFAVHDGTQWCLNNKHRYVPALQSGATWFRHPIASVSLYQACGDDAEMFLSGPTTEHPDLLEQVLSRPVIASNREMMRALARLYWDSSRREFTGPEVTSAANPLPDGCLRRFVGKGGFVDRFRATYDFHSMTCEQILDLLPAEFDRYKR